MKKKSLFIAAAALLLTSQVAMAASPKTTTTHVLDVVDPATHVSSQSVTTPEGIISTEAASLAVPLYSQSGQSWSSQIMQTCGTTISSEGCALTATAMVFKYYGVAIDPGTLNTKMGSYACPIYWGEAVTRAGAGIVKTVSTSSPTAWTSVYPAAKAALDAGKPYILGINKAGGGTHFFVLSGYTDSGNYAANYTIKDPAGGVTRSLSYYSTTGATPYRGVVYSK
ncbi:MAG: C39 family peptidase [Tumebacillaceae bacterium]